jgi:hypothetical protein
MNVTVLRILVCTALKYLNRIASVFVTASSEIFKILQLNTPTESEQETNNLPIKINN